MPIVSHKEQNRITGLDAYRIFACLQVFINHCNSKVMAQVEPRSMAWFVTVAIVYITKVAVPGFFMITGYNLLHREDDWSKNLDRIRRVLVDLVVFSLLYYIWKCANGTIVITSGNNVFTTVIAYIWGFISILWTSPMTDAFWYLYAYLGILLVLPFLQKMASGMDKKDMYIFLGLAGVFVSLLPVIYIFAPAARLSVDFSLPVIEASFGSVMYLFAGHLFYLKKNDREYINDKKVSLPVLTGGVAIGLMCNMILSLAEYKMTAGESFLSMSEIQLAPLALESVCLFAILTGISYNENVEWIIGKLAPATFGVYLITDFVCSCTHMIYYTLCQYMNRLLAVAVQDVAAIVIAFAVIILVRMIKPVRKWI